VIDIRPCLTRDTVESMAEVGVRDLRNHGGKILDRVAGGEALTVTRDGLAVAELRPLPRRPLPAAILLQRWHGLPPVDPMTLRADIDDLVDPSL
jgi:antitoxin (DNA-binding transcriptional repressor) of toxin-antitoxin stability system